jgi:hypothetical protein
MSIMSAAPEVQRAVHGPDGAGVRSYREGGKMAETIEIKRYQYYTFSSRDSSIANSVILLYGNAGYLGGAFFGTSDEPLKPAEQFPSGVYGLYYDNRDLPVIIDMLRNEKPVYLIFNGAENTRISTTAEPVGEGEE